jgi:hypothetical protein
MTTTTTSVCIEHTYYRDADNDTFGNSDNATQACEAPAGYVDNGSGFDCDDADEAVHPGAEEICNGIDDDCNGLVDDNETCAEVCSVRVYPRRISKLRGFLSPNMIPFAIAAAKDSCIEFQHPVAIDWGTLYIDDYAQIRVSKKSLFGILFVSPIRLERGDFTVTVRFGPDDTVCAGTIKVR